MNKKFVGVAIASALITIVAWTLFLYAYAPQVFVSGSVGVDLETESIHCHVAFYQNGKIVFEQHHPGVVTDLGDNMTLYKLWGDSDHQYGSLNSSAYTPYISIGNDTGTLASTSTVLPNEWHREVATVDNEHQSYLNFSCTISGGDIPGASQTADCIGICLTETDDANDLWAYDTFNEVTGIDTTFTINIDFQVSVSHS